MSPGTASSAKNTQSNQNRKQDAKQTARATRLRQSQSASSPYAAMNKKILEESKRAQLVLMNMCATSSADKSSSWSFIRSSSVLLICILFFFLPSYC